MHYTIFNCQKWLRPSRTSNYSYIYPIHALMKYGFWFSWNSLSICQRPLAFVLNTDYITVLIQIYILFSKSRNKKKPVQLTSSLRQHRHTSFLWMSMVFTGPTKFTLLFYHSKNFENQQSFHFQFYHTSYNAIFFFWFDALKLSVATVTNNPFFIPFKILKILNFFKSI